jgi:hypothetical protein
MQLRERLDDRLTTPETIPLLPSHLDGLHIATIAPLSHCYANDSHSSNFEPFGGLEHLRPGCYSDPAVGNIILVVHTMI